MAPTTIRVIPKEEMLRLLRTEPSFSEYFISYLLKRNMQIGQQVIDLLFDSSERRLIRTLLFLAQFGAKNGDDVTISQVPQELLAEMIGSTRTHVNGFMTKLKRLGFVEYNGGRLKIHRTPLCRYFRISCRPIIFLRARSPNCCSSGKSSVRDPRFIQAAEKLKCLSFRGTLRAEESLILLTLEHREISQFVRNDKIA